MTFFRSLAPLVATIALSGAAHAATLLADGDSSDLAYVTVNKGETATAEFDVSESLKVDFLVLGTDTDFGKSIELTVVGIEGEEPYKLTPSYSVGSLVGAGVTFSYIATGAFSLIASVSDTAPGSVSFAYSYEASAVPVPAAGLLLGTALVGAGVAARRRRG
ncbi:VPLPA-CTERM sorting domain-containing protein [Mangrovicoccus ximenensis]|uniref:VPLPA-CTERM sorting domain-containing protein n=1 Tax=Mangrovicoccus ximenensis TaxID=1911570 RepID=UPI000D33DF8B|nr:VPLPA-CTERM sorting domain-containing protein [Mangrovicoccus ximenensis]